MSFRNHFDMISLNEPVTRKAKFWQSYVRALKGTEDMRADDRMRFNPRPRALSEFPDFIGRSIYDDDKYSDPNTRIALPGYRYMPISRETYGYTPRAIYGPVASPRYAPRPFSVPPEDFYGREGSPFLRDTNSYPRAYEPFLKELSPRANSPTPLLREITPFSPETPVPSSYYPRSYYYRPYSRSLSPVPRIPIDGGRRYPYYRDLLNPSPYMPISALTRDPWWHDAMGLRPYSYYPLYPSALRTSYLSPVKNRYLWTRHPMRYL